MQDYYEKQEARRARLEARAEKLHAASRDAWKRSWGILEVIPAGQPILVGHHSEQRHRRDLERSDNLMRQCVELQHRAEDLDYRLAHPSNVISSDAPDAIERLKEKLAGLEAEQERMKAENARTRRGEQKPFASWQLSNNNANIRRVRGRIADLEKKAQETSREWEFEGGRLLDNVEENRVQILFDAIPGADVRQELKRSGFRWSPRAQAWQRMRGGWALSEARRIVNLQK